MLRSDAKPLSYLELESFIENVEKGEPADTAAAREPEPTKDKPSVKPLEHCPHCASNLSAFEQKLAQCMACQRPLTTDQREEDAERRPVSIGI